MYTFPKNISLARDAVRILVGIAHPTTYVLQGGGKTK